jgi:hypothetical protein
MREPTVTINGKELTSAQALTLRVGLNIFLMGLKELQLGGTLENGYRQRGIEVLTMMLETPQELGSHG